MQERQGAKCQQFRTRPKQHSIEEDSPQPSQGLPQLCKTNSHSGPVCGLFLGPLKKQWLPSALRYCSRDLSNHTHFFQAYLRYMILQVSSEHGTIRESKQVHDNIVRYLIFYFKNMGPLYG